MPVPQRFIDQYGSLERVPEYIRKHYERRDREQQRRDDQLREAEDRKRQERERIKALRRPPTNVRIELVGSLGAARIHWEPPSTASELPPAGYWVSEERKGEWTAHGDYVLPHVRSSALYGKGPARVETWYHQMALGESYPSQTVHAESSEQAPKPSEQAPKPSESKPEADVPDEFECPKERLRDIILAIKSYSGRRTRDGRPWVRYLRVHAKMQDISVRERDEAWRIVQG